MFILILSTWAIHGRNAGSKATAENGGKGDGSNISFTPCPQSDLCGCTWYKGKGLWRSDNKGDTWEKRLDDDHLRGVAIAPQDSNVIYATSSYNYHSGRDDLSYLGERPLKRRGKRLMVTGR